MLHTQFGPVVITRIAVDDSATRTRQDSKRNIEPLTGDPEQWFTVTTRHRRYLLTAADILAAVRDGKRKLVLQHSPDQ